MKVGTDSEMSIEMVRKKKRTEDDVVAKTSKKKKLENLNK